MTLTRTIRRREKRKRAFLTPPVVTWTGVVIGLCIGFLLGALIVTLLNG